MARRQLLLLVALAAAGGSSAARRRNKSNASPEADRVTDLDALLQSALACGGRSCAVYIDAAIEAGADVNARNGQGQTPVMASVLQGNLENFKALLKHNPDLTIAEDQGYTPMHGAGFQGAADIITILVEHGMDPLDRHKDGYIAMHRSCWGGEQRHTDAVAAFLKAGVPWDFPSLDTKGKAGATGARGETPLEMVRNNPGTTKLLEEWAKKDGDRKAEL